MMLDLQGRAIVERMHIRVDSVPVIDLRRAHGLTLT